VKRPSLRRPRLTIAVLLLGILAAWPATDALAWCRLTTEQDSVVGANGCTETGLPLVWTRRCISYSLYIGGSENLNNNDLRPIIAAAFAEWTNVRCDGVLVDFDVRETQEEILCDRAVYNGDSGNANGIMFVRDWVARDHDPEAFALTSVWHNGKGVIRDGDMEINDTRNQGVCPSVGPCTFADVGNVVTHEAGHFFGMAHSQDENATMFASAKVGEIMKRDLAPDDEEGLCTAYPPGTLTGTCETGADFSPSGGFEATCAAEGGCTCRLPGGTRSGAPGALSMGLGLVALGVVVQRARRRRRA